MPLVSAAERLEVIQRLPDPLRALARGEVSNPLIEYRCTVPFVYTYARGEDSGGPLPTSWDSPALRVIPLWECGTSFVALTLEGSACQFIEVHFEEPDERIVIGTSARAVLAYLMFYIVEDLGGASRLASDESARSEIEKLRRELEFADLDGVLNLQAQLGHDLDYVEKLLAYTQGLSDDRQPNSA